MPGEADEKRPTVSQPFLFICEVGEARADQHVMRMQSIRKVGWEKMTQVFITCKNGVDDFE